MIEQISSATALPIAAYGHWGWEAWPWFILVALLGAALIAAAIWLIRGATLRPGSAASGGAPSAIEILDRRFAEGEISAEEYRARRETLESGRR
jgi:putative membrane protein